MPAEKEHGPMLVIVMTLIVVTMFGWGLWIAYGEYIMNAIKWLCIIELYGIDVFVRNPAVAETRNTLLSFRKEDLDWNLTIMPALYFVGQYMKYVFIPALAYMSYQAFMHPPKKMLRHPMGLDAMIKFQSKAWKYITPFVDYDPGKESSRALGDPVPRRLKSFAEALSPEEWLVYNDIAIDKDSYEFDEPRAKKVFQRQLGRRWRGVNTLPDYERALFAAFALKGVRKRDEADDLLAEISLCWSRKKGFVLNRKLRTKVYSILRNKNVGPDAVKVANDYAYVNSAMLAVLAWARSRGGVLAPAQFVWLRGVDRKLWYALNSLGRRTYFSEGSGSIAHYYTEKGIGKPLVTINVDRAIDSIKTYMEEHDPEIPTRA